MDLKSQDHIALQETKPHNWLYHVCGRTCSECMLTQVKGEYDDEIPCPPSRYELTRN